MPPAGLIGMCFSPDARPPRPPIRGAAVDARDLVLTSRDGTELAAYAARADHPTGAGIVIVPDIRGLHPYYEELALRFAEAGVDAIAFDFYARTAGGTKRDGAFDPKAHVLQLQTDRVNDDVAAAVAMLRSPEGGAPTRIFTIGFCIGGRISLLQAAAGLELGGVIGFYPWPTGEHRSGLPAPSDEAPRFGCPVLTIYGEADHGIGPDARDAFARALAEAGIEHRSVTYPDAPHSFFDRTAEEHAGASAAAWAEVLSFMGVAVAD
ncbi:MAG TPA: dienelactone hydrolase family protein [Candidatus Angelobacter sp.]|nr:dienelactone hydrolase family protein [Candidatus Angelobacter sp.]